MFLGLPDDILLLIAEELESEADLSSMTSTNRRLYCVLTDKLHKNNIRYFRSSALFWAVRHNRLGTIERLLDLGADVNVTDEYDVSLLEVAACDGQVVTAKLLLTRGAIFRGLEGQPSPPICAAASAGNTGVLKVLLDWEESQEHNSTTGQFLRFGYATYLLRQLFVPDEPGANPPSAKYTIPLFLAIAAANDTTAEYLIQHPKIDLSYRDLDQRAPFHWAVSHGRDKIITSLIEHGADPNITGPYGQTSLQMVVNNRQARLVKLLLGFDAVDPNYCPHNRHSTPLCLALDAPKPDISIVTALLARPDIDLDCEMPNGLTILKYVLRMRDPEALNAFLARRYRGSVDSKSQDIRDALFDAADSGHCDLIEVFLANGADPTIEDRDGRTPHFYAARSGHEDTFTRFLQSGKVKLDAIDDAGWTPLFWACHSGQPAMAEFLLKFGANPNICDVKGATPLLYMVKAFHCHPLAPPKNPSKRPLVEEPLILVLNKKTIRLLLEYGADPFAKDARGWTIMSLALQGLDEEVARDLVRHARKAGDLDKVEEAFRRILQDQDGVRDRLGQRTIAT
ncbi:ankyrin repeat-containing domain protein [Aspergillus oleicola]